MLMNIRKRQTMEKRRMLQTKIFAIRHVPLMMKVAVELSVIRL
jgi:hypothetical protein